MNYDCHNFWQSTWYSYYMAWRMLFSVSQTRQKCANNSLLHIHHKTSYMQQQTKHVHTTNQHQLYKQDRMSLYLDNQTTSKCIRHNLQHLRHQMYQTTYLHWQSWKVNPSTPASLAMYRGCGNQCDATEQEETLRSV